MSDTHKYELNTARSKISIRIDPATQVLSVDNGKQALDIRTMVSKDSIQVEISSFDKAIYKGALSDLIHDLQAGQAFRRGAAKGLVRLKETAGLDKQTRLDIDYLSEFMAQ